MVSLPDLSEIEKFIAAHAPLSNRITLAFKAERLRGWPHLFPCFEALRQLISGANFPLLELQIPPKVPILARNENGREQA